MLDASGSMLPARCSMLSAQILQCVASSRICRSEANCYSALALDAFNGDGSGPSGIDSSGAPGSSGAGGSGCGGRGGSLGSGGFSGGSSSGAGVLGSCGAGFGFTGGGSMGPSPGSVGRMLMVRAQQQSFPAASRLNASSCAFPQSELVRIGDTFAQRRQDRTLNHASASLGTPAR